MGWQHGISLTQFSLTKPLTYLLNFLLSKWYIEFLPWSLLGGTESLFGGTAQYLVVLGHYWVVLVSTLWYRVEEVQGVEEVEVVEEVEEVDFT